MNTLNKNVFVLIVCVFLALSVGEVKAQYTFGDNIDNCPTNLVVATCSGSETFSDTYSNNPNEISGEGIQICSNDGSPVTITFTANTVEVGYDVVAVYDGTNQYNFPNLAVGDAAGFDDGQPAVGATFTSTNGCIYVMVSADVSNTGTIAFDIECAGGGAGSGLATEAVGPGTAGDGISPVNDYCANAYTLDNTYQQPVVLVANNYDATSGPGDNTCDPDPSDVSGQFTLETTVYFEYCTDANPGLYQGHGILNVENCIRPSSGGLGETSLLTGTCGNFTPVSYNIGDQLPASTCFTFMVDGLNGDECQFQPYFDESPPPTCDPVFTGTAESMWMEAPDCGFEGTWFASVDWGTFFTTDPCVTCVGPNCSVNIETDFQLVFVPTTDGVITPFDACAGGGTEMLDNDFNNLPAHSGGCEIEWYTIKYRVTGTSPDADCICDGYCFESPAANFPVFPDYLGDAFADITIIPGTCNADGSYTPTDIEVVSGSSCDGVVTVANSVIQPDPGCDNPTGDDLLVVELAVTPADFPASCGAAVAGTLIVEGITCACPAQCGATYDFLVDDFCSGSAAFFDLQPGCTVESNPATGRPYVDFDWYIYAPGGVPQQAPGGYDPLPATDDNFPIANPDLLLDGSETACSDVAGTNTISNTTCDPIIVTYFMLPWDRQFDSDNDLSFGEYYVGAGACPPLQFDVTIYPTNFSAVETPGNCSDAMVEIVAENGMTCPDYTVMGGTTADPGCGNPAAQNTLSYNITAATGSPCAQTFTGEVSSICLPQNCVPDNQCPSYMPVQAAGEACADQPYLVELPLDQCPGVFDLGIEIGFDSFGSEITWQVTDMNGAVVCTGGPYADGATVANEQCLNLDPDLGPYSFTIIDSYGDGLEGPGGPGYYTLTDLATGFDMFINQEFENQNGPVNEPISETTELPLSISPLSTLTVNWTDNDGVVTTETGIVCGNLSNNFVLTTTNVCTPEMQTVSYEVICETDGSVLTAGLVEVEVYPDPPTDETPLVDITIDDTTCEPMITYLNDCSAATVTVNTVTPPVACSDGNAAFEVVYDIGELNPPDCCSTAGPGVPFVDAGSFSSPPVATDQFGGTNNAAVITWPATGMGAQNATSLTLDIDVSGVDVSGINPGCGDFTWWVTVYQSGVIIYDTNFSGAATAISLALADMDAGQYDENDDLQIAVYPNCTTGAVYDDGGCVTDCWTGSVTADISITYELLVGSPIDCSFDVTEPYACSRVCPTPVMTNGANGVCSGELTTEVSDWQALVVAANPQNGATNDPDGTLTEILYSSTNNPAAPDGVLPTGTTANTCTSEDQLVYAFIGCDEDCDGTTDSYQLAGTFTLTVYPPAQAPVEIVRDDEVCTYSVTFACAGDTEGTTTVDGSTQSPGFPGSDADVEVMTANGCMAIFNLPVPPCPQCPSVIAPADAVQPFCETGVTPDFSDAATGFIPGTGTVGATLMWYMDQTTDGSTTPPATPYADALINLPTNNCDPASTTIYAYYVCDVNGDGSLLVYNAAGSITVEVYPVPDALVETSDPACTLGATAASCATPLVVEYSTDGGSTWNAGATVPGTPSEGDMADIRVYVAGGPTDANGDPLCVTSLTVTAENCIVCPTNPAVAEVMDQCGSGEIMASVSDPGVTANLIDVGTGQVVATTTSDANGEMVFSVGDNLGCEPLEYNFIIVMFCPQTGEELPGATSAGELAVTFTVYPQAFTATINIGGICGEGTVDILAANGDVCFEAYEAVTCSSITPPCSEIVFPSSVSFEGTFFEGTPCAMPVSSSTSCECYFPIECDCFSDPMLATDLNQVCGGGAGNEITLTTSIMHGPDISDPAPYIDFTITGDNGIGTVTAGSPIALPVNNTCNPIVYTFTASVLCLGGTSIPETTAGDLTASVTVYPNAFTAIEDATSAAGGCGDTFLDVVAADGVTVCDDNVATASCAPPANCVDPPTTGSSGNFSQTYFDDGNNPCPITVSGSVSCSCAPPACNCPTDPMLSADISEACGSGSVTLSTSISGAGTATFTITGDNGIGTVSAGSPIALPANNTCDPITYTFTATAVCDDNGSAVVETTVGDLEVSVTVYPNMFTTVVDGSSQCGDTFLDVVAADGVTVCDDNVATVNCTLPANCTDPDATDGTTWSGTYFTGTTCAMSFTDVPVSCTCPAPGCNCPIDPMLTADILEACGSGSVTLSTSISGVGTATFTITGDNGIGTVTAGSPIALPANNTCDPITYNFTATVVCDDDGSAVLETNAGDLTASVTVYPNAFATVVDGMNQCGDTHLDIVAADGVTVCADNVATATCSQPANCTDPAATASDTYTNTFFTGTSCAQTFTNEMVSCNCPAPGCNCPTDPMLSADITEVCGSGSITLSTSVSGVGSATFTITGDNGIGTVSAGSPIALPANNTCDPITYTFTATAVCDDNGSAVVETTAGDLEVTVTVYPNGFSVVTDGSSGCGDTHLDIVAGDGSTICADNVATVSCTEPVNCTDPPATASDTYTNTFFIDTPCAQTFTNEMVSCSCDPPSCDCPIDPMLSADISEACGSGSVTLSTSVSGTGTATFTITGDNGIGTVSAGSPIALPANNTCDPIVYTFTATAVCDDNGSAVVETTAGDLEVSVTVYPNMFTTVVDGSSGCGDTFLDVVAADGVTVCDDNVATITCTQPANCTDPADSQNTTWSGDYFTGTSCVMSLSNEPLSCSCDPPSCQCPSSPMITSDVDESCDGSSVTITGIFGNGTGGTFTITETSGAVTNIQDGVPFNMPVNQGCDPVTYAFIATVICDDSGATIQPSDPADLQVFVTVYPSNFTTMIDGGQGCGTTTLDVVSASGDVCDDDVATVTCNQPANCTDPDDVQSTTFTMTYFVGTSCEQNLSNVPLSCNCAAPSCNCPTGPMITADVSELCQSGSVTVTSSFSGGGGTGSITIMGDNGIGAVTSGVPVNLPANNTCDPIVYTFTATAVCDDNGGTIPPNAASDIIAEVTVYPDISGTVVELVAECTPGVISTCTSDITIMYDLDNDGTYESAFPPAAQAGGVTVNYMVSSTGAPAGCEVTGSYFNSCICTLDVMLINLDDGDVGGISPFYPNTVEVDVFNGVLPYTYDWDAIGYVRPAIINAGDNTVWPDGEREIRVDYSDNAYWSVTITDATGCQVVATNDPFAVGGVQEVIDIAEHEISGDNCLTRATGEGSITIYSEYGTPPYAYEWSGPVTWTGAQSYPYGSGAIWQNGLGESMTIENLPYGWYAVTITDSGIDDFADPRYFDAEGNPIIDDNPATPLPQQKTEGWYWVECQRSGGRGKVDATVPQVTATPNPFDLETNITFSVPEDQQVNLTLYTIDGQKVIDVFNGSVQGGILQSINFEAGPLATGLYMLTLTTESGEMTYTKMVINKQH